MGTIGFGCAPLTSCAIELKFEVADYVGGITPHAKKCKNQPPGLKLV